MKESNRSRLQISDGHWRRAPRRRTAPEKKFTFHVATTEALGKHGGDRKTLVQVDNVNLKPKKHGNSSDYQLAKIKRHDAEPGTHDDNSLAWRCWHER